MMGGFGMGGFGIIFLLLIVALVVWALVRVLPKGSGDHGGSQPRTDSAEETLRNRLARGEIDAEEYESSLATLRGERTKHSNQTQQ